MYRYDLCYLLQETWYKLNLGVDSNIFEVKDIKNAQINFMTLTFDLEKSRSNIPLRDLYYLWLYTCYRLDLGVDFNIHEVGDLK